MTLLQYVRLLNSTGLNCSIRLNLYADIFSKVTGKAFGDTGQFAKTFSLVYCKNRVYNTYNTKYLLYAIGKASLVNNRPSVRFWSSQKLYVDF